MSEVKIPENVRGMADKAKKAITINGAVAELQQDFYETALEERGLSMKVKKDIDAFEADFAAGLGLGFGELATAAMKKDKKIEEISLKTNVNKDVVAMRFQREYDRPVGRPGEGERVTEKAYGKLIPSWTKSSAAGSKGAMKKVRTLLGEAATAALK